MFDGHAQPLTKLSELLPSPHGDDAHCGRSGAAALRPASKALCQGCQGGTGTRDRDICRT